MMTPADDAAAWIASLEQLLDDFDARGAVPRTLSTPKRWCHAACCVVCCSPCCVWSTVWRLLLCPCMCAFKGCGYACSNNGCTTCTDKMIEAQWTAIHAPRCLGPCPLLVDRGATTTTPPPDPASLERALLRVAAIFGPDAQQKQPQLLPLRYELADALFAQSLGGSCTPYQVASVVERIRKVGRCGQEVEPAK